jgi:phytanoyl-CoA hydroxylase
MDMARAYAEQGFFAVENLFDLDEIATLSAELTNILRGGVGEVVGASNEPGQSDADLLNSTLAIHHPHKLSQRVAEIVSDQRISGILETIIGPDVKAMQTMMFVKKGGKPGQAWHQDEHFIATRDRSLCGVWIAIDDATIENGCLWVHPGSHQPGILYRMEPHGDARFDAAQEAVGFPYPREGGQPIELKAGGVAFFNGYTLHRSLPNRVPGSFRRALVVHYMSARSLLPWTMGGRQSVAEDVRDIVMVAGTDPYSYKGITSVTIPYIRPENAERAAGIYEQLHSDRERLLRQTAAITATPVENQCPMAPQVDVDRSE